MRARVYLVVNGRGDCRLNKRRPLLNWDEVAFPINVQVPQAWGRVYDDAAVDVTLPAPPYAAALHVDEPVQP